MKKFTRSLVAVVLALAILSSFSVCFAATENKQYHKYEKVMLLGDSEASGFTDYGDEMSEFTRVDDSYAAYIADEFGAELLPYACPGFRTIELRYMLDDTYRPDDKYLFTQVPRTSKEDILAKSDAMRQAIKDTDMIMIGIGGNDWGAYLGWTMEEVQLENNLPEDYKAALSEFLRTATFEDNVIAKIIELADYFNALDDLAAALPEAMNYAFSNLRTNWEYLVEYFYENNPDVTLVVVGMFPTYLQTPKGSPEDVAQPDEVKMLVEDAIIDYGNKHMVENQEKYGYIYVEPKGVVVEDSHPTVAGHRTITNAILEALPHADFPYTDVPLTSKKYVYIETMWKMGIIDGVSETEFAPDAYFTTGDLSKALAAVSDKTSTATSNEVRVSRLDMILALYNADSDATFMQKLKFFGFIIKMMFIDGQLAIFSDITRSEAAVILYNYVNL